MNGLNNFKVPTLDNGNHNWGSEALSMQLFKLNVLKGLSSTNYKRGNIARALFVVCYQVNRYLMIVEADRSNNHQVCIFSFCCIFGVFVAVCVYYLFEFSSDCV